MGRRAFDNYGKIAISDIDFTVASGRYATLKSEERRVLADVMSKLAIEPSDDVLEIGCGVGNLLIPLSFAVNSVTGIDHRQCLAKLSQRFPLAENLHLIEGNFLDLELLSKKFSKVLAYSVVQVLSSELDLISFVMKAAKLLAPGGRMLIGDILNNDKYDRVQASDVGRQWRERFEQQLAQFKKQNPVAGISDALNTEDRDETFVKIDDDMLLSLMKRLRSQGYESFLLPQPAGLPFGPLREDLLVCR